MTLQINTNGTMLEHFAELIVESEVDVLDVSIDGPENLHDYIRGVGGTFCRAVKGIKKVVELKQRLNTHLPHMILPATITEHNYSCFKDLYKLSLDLKLDTFHIQPCWFTTPEFGHRYAKEMKSFFGCDATSWKGFEVENHAIDIQKLRDILAELVSCETHNLPIRFQPDFTLDEFPEWYTNIRQSFGYGRCVMPWLHCQILANGDMTFCIDPI